MLAQFLEVWHWVVAALSLGVAAGAGAHVTMYKRDTRSAVAWLAFILILPLVGALSYLFFGINRIRRRAEKLYSEHDPVPHGPTDEPCPPETLVGPPLHELACFVGRVVSAPLVGGNSLELYQRGDAFDAMLGEIAAARSSVTLLTYIFDHDPVGLRFKQALAEATRRGVSVRVLIDAVGDRYSSPPMHRQLLEAGVRTAVFNPTLIPRSATYSNLRNHRKLLVVDGRRAFTGGMNLRHGHALEEHPPHPIRDVHFRVDGPIVASLQRVFADDWAFTTGERLGGEDFFPALEKRGEVVARAIDDGPAETFAHLRWTLLGALACARRRVRIATPYFLPDEGLVTALNMAARRGVEVEILLPERGNLKLVQWASTAMWWQVLEAGCRLHLTPPPFDHSKLMVVDDAWSLIGSANWDPRSLRLNFELNVEIYGAGFAARLGAVLDEKLQEAREVTLEEVDSRPLPIRLRDGLARLATPYL